MSILSTESFIAFGPVASNDDSDTTANNDARKNVAANLVRAGYQVSISVGNTANKQGFAVRPDPVSPDRNALFFSSALQQTNGGVGAAIRKILPLVNGEAVIGGFTLFVPPEFTKATAASTASCFRVFACGSTDTAWNVSSTDPTNGAREVFRVSQDLQVRWSTDAAQSQRTIVQGRVAFLEYRISATDIRVWLDDTLVMQKTLSLNVETVGIAFDTPAANLGSPVLVGAAGRWSVGNWYNLVEDAVAPNVRLGPTTRIIGVRPDTDVVAKFLRPNGYASNAAVMAQDLVDAPAATLQSSNVGDQDIYASTKDITTASGKLVHGITTKVMAANLESNPHTIRPVIRAADGTESTAAKAREWRMNATAISSKHLNGIARRPTDGKIFACGNSIALLTNSQNGALGSPWTLISDDGGTINYTAIAFRNDGWGILGRSDGKYQLIPPTADVPNAAINPGTSTTPVNHIIVLPDQRFFCVVQQQRIQISPLPPTAPDVVASWTTAGVTNQNNGNTVHAAYSPTLGTGKGRIHVTSTTQSGYTNASRSDDLGQTWTSVYNGTNTSFWASSWDPVASTFQMFYSTGAGGFVKSVDGITWTSPVTGSVNNGFVSGQPTRAYVDPDNNTSILLGVGGSMRASINSNEWRPITRLTTNTLRDICKAANGDYLVVGDGGTLIAYTAGVQDGLMAPLGGYLPYTAISPVNPATGAAWTPAEAAVAQFGMRLTS